MLRWKAPISTDHVIFDYTISWQMNAAYGNFYKSSKAWNLIEKTEYKKVYFHKLYNKCCIIKQIKAITWLCFFCPVWLIRERLNSFQVLSFHLFFFFTKKTKKRWSSKSVTADYKPQISVNIRMISENTNLRRIIIKLLIF